MLSIETESRIAKIFLTLADKEREVEISRQVLGQNIDFDAYQAFTFIDKEAKNSICAVNILDFLRRNGIFANLTEIQFVIQFYDENMDNVLSYTEFLNLVLSESNYTLRKLARERVGQCCPRAVLPFNVEFALVKLFEKEIDLARTLLQLNADVKMRLDFNVHNVFHLIKACNTITPESMRYFLNKNMAAFTDEDIRSIIKRLDFNRDSQIDFCEFHAFFSFPDCSKCCNCKHACSCCCVMSCSACRTALPPVNPPNSSVGNIGGASSLSTTNARLSPLRRTLNDSVGPNYSNSEVRRLSPNLALRMSPQRNYSPRGNASPRRFNMSYQQQQQQMPIQNNFALQNTPPRTSQTQSQMPLGEEQQTHLSRRASPMRTYSPRRRCSPCHSPHRRCSPHHSPCRNSPLRCHSPHRCCTLCHCNPCKCCSLCHCNPCKCCTLCHCNPCKCCHLCHCNPCRCCQLAFADGTNSLLSYIQEIMSAESQIEKAKIDLALRTDFNVEDAFRIFELDGRGIVTEADLKYGLSQLDIYATTNDIKLLMRRADIRRTGSLSYGDFFDLVTPFEKDYRSMVENRMPSSFTPQYNKADVFLLSTKIYLQNLLRLTISIENKLEQIRIGMQIAREQLPNIFNEMDRVGLGSVSDIDMNAYLQKKGVICSDRENGLAFIRLDRNRNGKVEFWEMEEELAQCF